MRTDGNYGATIPYQPNSYGEWQDSPNLKEPPLEVNGAIYNYDERELDSDYFTQPGKLWRRPTGDVREHGPRDGRQRPLHQTAARAQLLLRRSRIRQRRGEGIGYRL